MVSSLIMKGKKNIRIIMKPKKNPAISNAAFIMIVLPMPLEKLMFILHLFPIFLDNFKHIVNYIPGLRFRHAGVNG
jgi:hypothetical protein